MASGKITKAQKALDRVRNAGSRAKREAKQRMGVIGGGLAMGATGWAEAQNKWSGKLGPVHVSALGIPLAFATSILGHSATARQLEAAAGPLLGVALFKLGKGESVVGDEYSGVAGEYGNP